MKKPDYIYIGPPKSASTWLHGAIQQHPAIFTPKHKDIYYFDRYYQRGEKWYSSQFEDALSDQVIVEVSHDYLYSDKAANRILEDLPSVQLITILRNPYERAISHAKFSMRNGIKANTLSEAITSRPTIIDHGLYYKNLKKFFNIKLLNNMGVFYFDDLKNNPTQFLKSLYDYLGVDSSVELQQAPRQNSAASPRSRLLAQATHQAARIARDLGAHTIIGAIKQSRIMGILYSEKSPPSIDIDKKAIETMKEAFEPDIDKLSNLLNKDLSHWNADTIIAQPQNEQPPL